MPIYANIFQQAILTGKSRSYWPGFWHAYGSVHAILQVSACRSYVQTHIHTHRQYFDQLEKLSQLSWKLLKQHWEVLICCQTNRSVTAYIYVYFLISMWAC